MKLTILLITALVGSCFAQVAKPVGGLTLATLIPPPPPCLAIDIDVASFTARLDRGDIPEDESIDTASEAAEKLSIIPVPFGCAGGPKKVCHTVPGEFHWPQITRTSCDNLFCRSSSCIVRKSEWVSKCVHVFQREYGRWVYKGRQLRRYKNHLACGCKTCRDIYNFWQCKNTRPCPNSINRNSFCYWRFWPVFTIGPPTLISPLSKASPALIDDIAAPISVPHGTCQCCTPVPCKLPMVFKDSVCRCVCPSPPPRCKPAQIYNPKTCLCECPSPPPECKSGQTYNPRNCQCECPEGSVLDENNICVGDCEDVGLRSCSFVNCRDNPHFRCKSDGYRCKCPPCKDASTHQCLITKCLEQSSKPRCKLDAYNKCRCPNCEDQMDRIWCDMTHCGPNNHLQCSWNSYDRRCSCPH